jgi:probable HAF family extracellular repeat protein
MRVQTIIGVVGLAGGLTGAALAAPPGPSFSGIGVLPNGVSSAATGVSGDGETVVGWCTLRDGTRMAIKWTAIPDDNGGDPNIESIGVGICPLGRLPGTIGGADPLSEANAASYDGSIIVGLSTSYNGTEAFRWTPLEGIHGLGDLPSDLVAYGSAAFGVSDDGRTVVGVGAGVFCGEEGEAFVWTPETGMVGLGLLPAGRLVSRAYGISGDASVIVGCGKTAPGFQAGKWLDWYVFQELGDLPGGPFDSRAYAVSADGLTIVGTGAGTHATHPVMWTPDGRLVDLGLLPAGSIPGEALDVSADGSVVVGVMDTWNGDEAFVWDPAHGIRDLAGVLEDGYGVELGGWTLLRATGVSDDGMIVVGEGISPRGRLEGWSASIHCPADMNGDFIADITDFVAFCDMARRGDMHADCNHDGVVDITDYVCYATMFAAGCP